MFDLLCPQEVGKTLLLCVVVYFLELFFEFLLIINHSLLPDNDVLAIHGNL